MAKKHSNTVSDNVEIESHERLDGDTSDRDDYRNSGLEELRNKREQELLSDGVEPYKLEDEDEEELSIKDDSDEITPPSEVKHKIKVNGKEIELSYEELVAKAQKVEAADEYLRKAKETTENIQSSVIPSNEDVDSDEEDLELVRALQMGGEDEALAAIRKLRQSNKNQVSSDDIIRQVDERAKAQAASERFSSEYNDIMSDDVLRGLACQEDERMRTNGDTRSYYERYVEIGNNLRSWKESLTGKTTNDDKIQRKLNSTQVPKAAGKMQATPVEEEHEESRSEMIARIAKSRGQMY